MIDPRTLKRYVPAASAFVLVVVGTLLVLPNSDEPANAEQQQATLVAKLAIDAGVESGDLGSLVEVRMIPANARAAGALSSVEEIPEGVLLADLVIGQQLLKSSIAENVVKGLGDGFVAVSVRLDSQRWTGPIITTGNVVDVFDIVEGSATPIALSAVILDAPSVDSLGSRDESIVTLGVPESALAQVLVAANENRIWLVGS
jgi:hypothetical protein